MAKPIKLAKTPKGFWKGQAKPVKLAKTPKGFWGNQPGKKK